MSEESWHPGHAGPQVQECVRALKAIDFELAYLALLTRAGLKPLSRWEKPLNDDGLALLRRMGLTAHEVRRTVQTGRQVVETVFAVSPAAIRLYEEAFADRPIDKSSDTVRLEGYLFGYPPCCVEHYMKHPYGPNDLPEESRQVLFHWACPHCRITPLLLPAYAAIHTAVKL